MARQMPKSSRLLEAALAQDGSVLSGECPSRAVLRHVTSQWGVLLLLVLMERMHRFSELRRKVGGVSEKMLAQTLRLLEADGSVDRVSLPVIPPHVEYSLSPLGRKVAKRVGALAEWIEESLPEILEAREARSSKAKQRAP